MMQRRLSQTIIVVPSPGGWQLTTGGQGTSVDVHGATWPDIEPEEPPPQQAPQLFTVFTP